jgi:hypothetical protein
LLFLGTAKIQTTISRIHIPTLDDPTIANEAQWNIEQLF